MLRATRREMEKAYRWHRDQCNPCTSVPLRLLLIYSVECGLKVLLMQEYRVDEYEELPENARINHDISLGLTLLHAPPEIMNIGRLRVVTAHNKDPQQPVLPSELHQAFRYGIPIRPEDDTVAALQDILRWVREKLQ